MAHPFKSFLRKSASANATYRFDDLSSSRTIYTSPLFDPASVRGIAVYVDDAPDGGQTTLEVVRLRNGVPIADAPRIHREPIPLNAIGRVKNIVIGNSDVPAACVIAQRDSLAVRFTGSLAGVQGVVSIDLVPA